MCIRKAEDSLLCCSLDAIHLAVLRQGLSLLWSSLSRLGWLVRESQGSVHLCLPSGIARAHYHACLFVLSALFCTDSWDLMWVLLLARQAL